MGPSGKAAWDAGHWFLAKLAAAAGQGGRMKTADAVEAELRGVPPR